MSIHWEKVLTNPLGLAGYALCLVFGVVTIVIKQKHPRSRWTIPLGFFLATACVLGGLALAFHHEPQTSTTSPNPQAPSPSMRIGKVDQKVDNGNAVTGVQGNVTVTSNPPRTSSKASY